MSVPRTNTALVSSIRPRIDPEFQRLIAPLSPDEYRQLEANLLAEGCRDALVLWNGILLDGHNRFEICTRLNLPFHTVPVNLPNREAAQLWIEQNQMGRRNLTPDQRAAIGYRIMQRRVQISKVERARKGGLRLVAPCTTKNPQSLRERERAAIQLGVSTRRLRVVSSLAKDNPKVVEELVAGRISLKLAKIQTAEIVRRRLRQQALKTHAKGQEIHTGDYKQLWRLLKDNSVDLFLSDPIYDNFEQYAGLAELAKAKLKPGAVCAVCIGTYYLHDVLNAITPHLDYQWLMVAEMTGDAVTVWEKRVWQRYLPLLLFRKRCKKKVPNYDWVFDLIGSAHKEKLMHKWGKSAAQFAYLVERFAPSGGLVVDGFVGGGTTAVACKLTGRRFVGAEVDPGTAAAARARVAKTKVSIPNAR